MPVVLTDHVDRSKEKKLLRGRVGTVYGICFHPGQEAFAEDGVAIANKLPQAILVHFEGATWTVGALPAGVYPVKVARSHWYLDKGRQYPCLRVSRLQFPLAPAFAVTAHAAQGQTLSAAIVDLQIAKGTSPLASYVALTRVRSREDLLIYRPFARHLFTRGDAEGPRLLLQHLRGESIDWQAIEAAHMPHRVCSGCRLATYKDNFAASQWSRADGRHYCTTCARTRVQGGTPYECRQCFVWKAAVAFGESQLAPQRLAKVCVDCVEHRVCVRCGESKAQDHFTDRHWKRARRLHTKCGAASSANEGACDACIGWKCAGCGQLETKLQFTSWLTQRNDKRLRPTARCDACMKKCSVRIISK